MADGGPAWPMVGLNEKRKRSRFRMAITSFAGHDEFGRDTQPTYITNEFCVFMAVVSFPNLKSLAK